MANDYFFKVKLSKDPVKVSSTATIHLPFIDDGSEASTVPYLHGWGVPVDGKINKRISDDMGTNYYNNLSAYLAHKTDWQNILANEEIADTDMTGFPDGYPTDQLIFDLNDFLTRELTAEAIFQDRHLSPASLMSIYKHWTPTKFGDFVLETLVGKSLKQALLYNYFGFPVRNLSDYYGVKYPGPKSTLQQNWVQKTYYKSGDSGAPLLPDTSNKDGSNFYSMGNIPSFGTSDSTSIPLASFDWGSSTTNLNSFGTGTGYMQNPNMSIVAQLAGSSMQDFVDMGYQGFTPLNHLYQSRTPKIVMPPDFGTAVYKHAFVLASDGNFIDGLGITFGTGTALERPDVTSNILYYGGATGEYYYDPMAPQEAQDSMTHGGEFPPMFSLYDSPWNHLTPTHAKVFMPSLPAAMSGQLHKVMNGANGLLHSKFFYRFYKFLNSVGFDPVEDLTSSDNFDEAIAEKLPLLIPSGDDPELSFKFTNLASAMKLVPYGTKEENLQYYLENPNQTLNEMRRRIFDFVLYVVPDNVRHACPRPATLEPDSKALVTSVKPEAIENPALATTVQLKRMVSGSFFELSCVPPLVGSATENKTNYLGERSQMEDVLESAHRDTLINIQANVIANKGIDSIFTYNRANQRFKEAPGEAGNYMVDVAFNPQSDLGVKKPNDMDPSAILYKYGVTFGPYLLNPAGISVDTSIPKFTDEQIDYSFKFGLPANYFIGHRNQFGEPPLYADDVLVHHPQLAGELVHNNQQFAVMPVSPQTLYSMIDSLPNVVRRILSTNTNPQFKDFKYFSTNENINFEDPIERTRFITNLWMIYHFAAIPINLYEQGHNFLLDSSNIFSSNYWSDTVGLAATPAPAEGLQFKVDFAKERGIFIDYPPLLLHALASDPTRNIVKNYMPSVAVKQGRYTEGTGNLAGYAMDVLQLLTGAYPKDGGTIMSSDSLLGSGATTIHDLLGGNPGNETRYIVTQKSKLLFPVWDYQRGASNSFGKFEQFSAGPYDLNAINWPLTINSSPSSGMSLTRMKQFLEDAEPLVPDFDFEALTEDNPKLLDKPRECVPNWCTKLQVYPTIHKSSAKFGFIKEELDFIGTKIFKTGEDNDDKEDLVDGFNSGAGVSTDGIQYLTADDPADLAKTIDFNSALLTNYKNENLPLKDKAKPHIAVRFQYNTDVAKGILYETAPFGTVNFDFKTAAYRKGEETSPNYRNEAIGYAELTYATDLEIDERKLFLDMLRHGVFSLAGTGDEYKEAGFELDELFENGSPDSFLSADLKEKYRIYIESIAGILGAVDFSNLPSFLQGTDVTQELANALVEKEQEFYDKYISLTNEAGKCGATSIVLVDRGKAPTTKEALSVMRVAPGLNADVVSETRTYPLKNLTVVKVLQEWVNGNGPEGGDFNYIEVVDPDSPLNGIQGYVLAIDLAPIKAFLPQFNYKDDLFFTSYPPPESPELEYNTNFALKENGGLRLSPLEGRYAVRAYEEGQRLTTPIWWKTDQPYYNSEEGNFWYSVELEGETCIIDRSDLETKKIEAMKKGIAEVLDFFGKGYTTDQVEMLMNCCLGAEIANYYIDLRPGESIKFLLKLGAIYVNSFPNSYETLDELKQKSTKILTLDTRYYVNHLAQANFGLNKMYLDILNSVYRVEGVNFALEAGRMDKIPILLKQLISLNDFSLNVEEQNLINIGFDNDYNVIFISYNEGAKEEGEALLSIGFDYIKNKEPFNVQNTMSLFYHHRQLKNPLLDWKYAIEEFFVEPKPLIVLKDQTTLPDLPSSKCKPPRFQLPTWQELLGPIAAQLDDALQLDPRYDLGSFQFNLTEFLPPCPKPPSGRGPVYFKGEIETVTERAFFEDIESLKRMADIRAGYDEYVGDFMGSAEDLQDMASKVFDLDDLYDVFLRRVGGFPEIYNKICRCFIDLAGLEDLAVPNLSVDLQGGSGGLNIKPLSYIPSLDPDAPSDVSITGGKKAGWDDGEEYELDGGSFGSFQAFKDSINTDPTIIDAKDLICSFCLEVPDFFIRLPTTNILDVLIDALLKALEFILAQLLLGLLATLLDLLLQCPEITCPEGAQRVKDYGAQDLNDIMSGDTTPAQMMELCGLVVDDQSVTAGDVQDFLIDLSEVLSSSEVLQLFDGSMSDRLIKVVDSKISNYPGLKQQLPNTAKIRDFFRCLGFKLPPGALATIEDVIIEKYQDPDVCQSIYDDAVAKLGEKCGIVEDKDKIIKDATEAELDRYKALANLIRELPDLTSQIPPIFADNKGNKGLLSGLSNPTIDYAVEKTIENVFKPVSRSLNEESKAFFNPRSNVMIKIDPDKKAVIDNDLRSSAFYIPIMSTIALGPIGGVAALISAGVLTGTALFFDKDVGLGVGNFFPMNDNFAPALPKGSSVNIPSVVGILESFASGIVDEKNYLKLDVENNFISIKVGAYNEISSVLVDGGYIDGNIDFNYQLTAPDKINGVPVYTNNQTITANVPSISSGYNASSSEIVLFPNDKDSKTIDQGLLDLLNQYELDDSTIPPQIQYFMKLLADKVFAGLNTNNEQLKNAKNKIENVSRQIYSATLQSLVSGVANRMAGAEYSKKFSRNLFDEIEETSMGLVPFLIDIIDKTLAIGGGELVAETSHWELERFNLTPSATNDKKFSAGLIDLNRVAKIAQDKYDFSQYTDPNSSELGMPHYALLEATISAIFQMVCGEMLSRGLISFSQFPSYVFTSPDDAFVEFVYEELKSFLTGVATEQSWESGLDVAFQLKFQNVIKFIVSSRADYVTNEEIDPYNPPSLNNFYPGKIFDTRDGREYIIDNAKDAIKYYIRQELPSSIEFLTSRVASFALTDNSKATQANPLELISYSTPLYVHDEVFSTDIDAKGTSGAKTIEEESPFDLPSSLFDNERYEYFLNGRFFFQQYFEIEELSSTEDNYREDLVNRDSTTKGIISQDNLFLLMEQMTGNKLGTKDPSGLTPLLNEEDINGDLAFKDFFKSIKFGMRLCYGFIRSDREYGNTEGAIAGYEEIDAEGEPYKPYSDNQAELFKTISDVIDEALCGEKTAISDLDGTYNEKIQDELREYIKLTKSIVITEFDEDIGNNINTVLKSYIFPLLLRTVEITNNSEDKFNFELFDQNPADVAFKPEYLREYLYVSQGQLAQQKCLQEIVLSDEYSGLFRYSLSVPQMIYMFSMMNIAVVSVDPKVRGAFSDTRTHLKTIFNSIYTMTGPERYKKLDSVSVPTNLKEK
jgi:hypothetical protein